jgi:hypothetical protein
VIRMCRDCDQSLGEECGDTGSEIYEYSHCGHCTADECKTCSYEECPLPTNERPKP